MSKITKNCKYCQKPFTSYIKKNRNFCSKKCSGENYSKNTRTKYNCEICKKEIIGSKLRQRKFCSITCRNKSDAIKYTGKGNPNFGKKHPSMFKHSTEARIQIKEKVKASWKTIDRVNKHKLFLEAYREEYGYIPIQSPEAKEKAYENFLQSLETRTYGGWKGIKQGWYTSSKTNTQEYYSSSYELRRMIELDNDNNVKFWTKQHSFLVPYVLDGNTKKYKPDFYIEYDNRKCVEEIKGFIPKKDIAQYCSKLNYATEYFSKLGIEYLVNFKYKIKNEVICGQD